MTKDFSYSYCSLLPKDKRESAIYLIRNTKEIGQTYLLYLCLMGIIPIIKVISFTSERSLFNFLSMLYTFTFLGIRIVGYLFQDRYPRVFRVHLVLIYIIDLLRFSVEAYYKLSQESAEMKEEMAGVYYKTA